MSGDGSMNCYERSDIPLCYKRVYRVNALILVEPWIDYHDMLFRHVVIASTTCNENRQNLSIALDCISISFVVMNA